MRVQRKVEADKVQTMVRVSYFFACFLFSRLDSFRRFVKDIGSIQNPEYAIDISKGIPAISDYGNIQIEP